MKKTFLFSLMTIVLAGFGFGGVSLAQESPDPVEKITVTYYYEGEVYSTIQVDKGTKKSELPIKSIDDSQFCNFYTAPEQGASTYSFGATQLNADENIYGKKCSVTILDENDNVLKKKYVDKNYSYTDPTDEYLTQETYAGKCFYFALSKTATTAMSFPKKITTPAQYYLINKECKVSIYVDGTKVEERDFTRGEAITDFTNEFKATNENLAGFYKTNSSTALFDFTQQQYYPVSVYGREYNLEVDGEKVVGDLTLATMSGKQVKLLKDFSISGISKRFNISNGESIYIDLNGHNITANAAYFNMYNGSVELVGPGKITLIGNAGFFQIYGSTTNDSSKNVYVKIGEGVEIESSKEKGIAVRINPSPTSSLYGVTVDVYGKLTNSHELGFAIYTNGSATNTENAPIINLKSGSEISNPNGYPIYLAGYSTTTIEDNVKVTGKQAAIEIRAGILNIEGGEFTSTSTTTFETANGNGTTIGGAAIAVSQHTTNKPLEVNISGGKFTGKRSIYEKDLQGGTIDNILLSISGGEFDGEVFSENNDNFIKGGIFSTQPTENYIAAGKRAFPHGNQFKVATVRTVTFNPDNGGEITSVDVEDNTTVDQPANPTKAGKVLLQWNLNSTEFDFATPITTNITLVAQWGDMSDVAGTAEDPTYASGFVFEPVGELSGDTQSSIEVSVASNNSTAEFQGVVELNVYSDEDNDDILDPEEKTNNKIDEKVNFTAPVLVRIPVNLTGSVKVKVRHNGESTFGIEGLTTNSAATCTNGVATNANDRYDGSPIPVVGGYVEIYTCSASTFVAYTETQNPTTPTYGGGGGSTPTYSCKNLPDNAVANNTTKPSKNTDYSYSTNTGAVCTFQCKTGYTWNTDKKTCDKADETVSTGDDTTDDTNTENLDPKEVLANGFTREFNDAYEFAFANGITTMKNIEEAAMEDGLNRIAMAKMLSQYAINVLKKTPDTSKECKFSDVSEELDAQYDHGVTLACQLGIMGVGITEFRPDDLVVRAEFGTALSRLLFGLADGEEAYYTTHLAKLKEAGIISNDDPSLEELRGYVMLMLMRSAK